MRTSFKILYMCFTITPILLAFLIKKRRNFVSKSIESCEEESRYYYINLFLFNRKSCRDHVIKNNACSMQCPQIQLKKLSEFIGTATQSISICVLTLQLLNIYQEIIKAQRRGIIVRIILDKEMIAVNSKRLQKLKAEGVIIKTQGDDSCLHHKFCIIDGDDEELARMFFGSMNFTMQGILCNYEHITLTNDCNIIKRFLEEFNALWEEFSHHI